jgi:ribosome biogenesis protein UTP30
MSPDEIITNIMDGVSEIAKIIPRGWTNIQSLNIKSSNSIALPIHTSLPDNIEAILKEPRTQKRKVEDKIKARKSKKKKLDEDVSDDDGNDED